MAVATLALALVACGAEGYVFDQVAAQSSTTPSSGQQPSSPANTPSTSTPTTSTDADDPAPDPTPSTSTCSATPDTYANYIQAQFSGCQACHAQKYGTLANITTYQVSIRGQVASDSMPPGGFSSADKQRVLTYLNCPAPLP